MEELPTIREPEAVTLVRIQPETVMINSGSASDLLSFIFFVHGVGVVGLMSTAGLDRSSMWCCAS